MPEPDNRGRIAQITTLTGMVLDVVLGILKIIAGYLAHSHALIADGVHSLSDAVSDVMVIVITRFSHEAPDDQHPYGHKRIETLGTMLLGGTLIAVAGALAYDSAIRWFSGELLVSPGWLALIVALVSILSKEWIFRYTLKKGKEINSKLLIANAWHSRSDALSSIIVFIAIGGGMMGMAWLDPVAVLIVGFFIAKIGWDLGWESVKELIDTGLSPEQTREIAAIIRTIPGVKGIHSLRSRKMGDEILLDVHIQVPSRLSVSEGHHIGTWVTHRLLEKFSGVRDVIFHIDAEDDSEWDHHPADQPLLPLRHEILDLLADTLPPPLNQLTSDRCAMHFLSNQVSIDIFLDEAQGRHLGSHGREVEKRISQLKQAHPWLEALHFWTGAGEASTFRPPDSL